MKTLSTGDKVPDFTATDQDGNPVSTADFQGKTTVVFFYPKADTPGCTAEACSLRNHYADLQAAGYTLLGVSADSEKKQAKFREKYHLPFPLVADTQRQVIDAFGVWGPKKFMGRTYDGIHRITFVVGPEGTVTRVIDKVKTKEHAAQILDE